MRVAICIATCRRPEGLDRLLTSLSQLRLPTCPDIEIRLIVVDNDALGSGRPVVGRWRPALPWPLVYEVEPRPGIPMARNRLVALAQDADFVAFIDDDEVASVAWLDELLSVQMRYGADVVGGPVVPRFEIEPPDWIKSGRFFEHPRHGTGEPVDPVGTGNVLVSARLLRSLQTPFDERMALSGGADSHLTRRLRELGARFAWADEALVHEWVPRSRARERWLFRRSYRVGNALALCDRSLAASLWWVPLRAMKGLGRIGQGLLGLGLAPFAGRAAAVRAVCHLCRGAGMVAGMFGHRFLEYRRTDGT